MPPEGADVVWPSKAALPQHEFAEVLKLSHIVLHPSSVKNQRFLPASPQGEAFWALPHRWIYRKANDDLLPDQVGPAGGAVGTGEV